MSLPHFQYSVPCYDILCAAEVASNMAKYTGSLFGKIIINKQTSLYFMKTIN